MGGEVSLMAEQSALDALTGLDGEESGRALRSAGSSRPTGLWQMAIHRVLPSTR